MLTLINLLVVISTLLGLTNTQNDQLTLEECFDKYEKGIYPHESDCTKFLSCATGEPLDCPAGLHFNPTEFVCDWPANAGCMKVTTPFPEPKNDAETPSSPGEESPTTPSDTPSETTSSSETDKPSEQTPGESEKPNEGSDTTTKSSTTPGEMEESISDISYTPKSSTSESKNDSEASETTPTPTTSGETEKSTEASDNYTSSETTPKSSTIPEATKTSEDLETTPKSSTTPSEPEITSVSSETTSKSSTTPSESEKTSESSETTTSKDPTGVSETTPLISSTTPSESEKTSDSSKTTPISSTTSSGSEKTSEPSETSSTKTSESSETTPISSTSPSESEKTTDSSETTSKFSKPEKSSDISSETTPLISSTTPSQSETSDTSETTVKPSTTSSENTTISATTLSEEEKTSEFSETTPKSSSTSNEPKESSDASETTPLISSTTPSESEKTSDSSKTTPIISTTPSESEKSSEFSETTTKSSTTTPNESESPSDSSDSMPKSSTISNESEKTTEPSETSSTPKLSETSPTESSETTPASSSATSEETERPSKASEMTPQSVTSPSELEKPSESEEATPKTTNKEPSSSDKELNQTDKPIQDTTTAPKEPEEQTLAPEFDLPPEPTHASEVSTAGPLKELCDFKQNDSCSPPKPELERRPPGGVTLGSRFGETTIKPEFDNREPLTKPPPAGFSIKECLAQHKFGIFAHPSSSNKFFICTKARPLEMTCPQGLEFDQASYGCGRPKLTTTPPPPEYNLRQCLTQYPRGLFSHPTDCAKFYACTRTGPIVMSCPQGLHFNPMKLVCDWPSRYCIDPATKTRNSILKAMKGDHIVPDLIDRCPDKLAEVAFPSGGQANLGQELTPSQTLQPPSIYWEADRKSYYTLCMVDPDAPKTKPSQPNQINHWTVGNIPGNQISRGQPLTEYLPPCPQQNSPPHRYTYMIYKQPGRIKFQEPRIPANSFQNRNGFSLRNFVERYQLGNPIAGNYFKCRWDRSVPMILQKLQHQTRPFFTMFQPGFRTNSNSFSYSYSIRM